MVQLGLFGQHAGALASEVGDEEEGLRPENILQRQINPLMPKRYFCTSI